MRSPQPRLPRILVTGAGGQVGRTLQQLMSRPTTPPAHYHFATRAQLDITDAAAVAAWLDRHPIDCCINAAAWTDVTRAPAHRSEVMAINVTAAGALASQCARRGIRLLHLSSDYVFDGRLQRPCRETDPVAPVGTYGHSKARGEQAVMENHHAALILRTSWLFGASPTDFVSTLLARSQTQETLPMVVDQTGTPTWVMHLALVVHRLALGRDWPGAGIYHFAGQPCVTRQAFAQAILSEAVKAGHLRRMPALRPMVCDPAGPTPTAPRQRPTYSCLDSRRLEACLGPLERDWREGLRRCLRPDTPATD